MASSGKALFAMTICRLAVNEANPNKPTDIAMLSVGVRSLPPTYRHLFSGSEKYSDWKFLVELSRLEQITNRTNLLIDMTAVGTNQP